MPKEYQEKRGELASLFYKGELVRIILQSILGLGLLAGGITLLALRLPGWSVIFGLPMVVISSIFIIYTYDNVLSKYTTPKDIVDDKDLNSLGETNKNDDS